MISDRILLIDADKAHQDAQRAELSKIGCNVEAASDARQALQMIELTPPGIVICNIQVPGSNDRDLLRQLTRRLPESVILVTSEPADRERAIEAAHRGAHDYLEKPIRFDELLLKLHIAHERSRLDRDNRLLRWEVARSIADRPIVAASASMIELLEALERVAADNSSVLLVGEAGTGKEVLARAIHAQSPRRSQSFVAVNCALKPAKRVETELFGSAHGAMTSTERSHRGLFVDADQGTLFLDEIGELPASLQARLLEVIQSNEVQSAAESDIRSVDVRVLAATARNLEEDVVQGRFRADLHDQLSVVRLDVPALRDRPKDIPLLVDHFVEHYRHTLVKTVRGIADDALERLVAHHWRGNVRELENVIERAMIVARGDRVATRDLPQDITTPSTSGAEAKENLSLKKARRAIEIDLIRQALRASGGNRTHAAKRLDISHRALLYKLKDYGIRD
jgi:two-component system response regulator AtoC